MSRMSEQHHDATQAAEPEPPFTMDEWVELRRRCAMEGWRESNVSIPYDTAWRLTDAVLRHAMPERVPPEGQ